MGVQQNLRRAYVPALALLLVAGCGARSSLETGAPPPMQQQGASQSVVLFGGISAANDAGISEDLGDTWVWTPTTEWTEMHPPTSPSPRYGAAAATLGGDTVLFGGDGMVAETWSWNGTTWAQQQPAAPPPPLVSSLLAPLTPGLVLFAGYDYGAIYHDVWGWDGTSWTHESPAVTPPARDAPAGAVLDGSLVIFGGEDVNMEPLGDTWVFDGTSWTQMQPAHSPSPRRGAVAAAIYGKIVMFGGDTLPPSLGDWLGVDETWVWDGSDWTQQQPAQSPDARSFAGMAAAGGQLVLFGGFQFGGSYADPTGTWTWDGTTWTEHTGPGPAPRNEPTMASR